MNEGDHAIINRYGGGVPGDRPVLPTRRRRLPTRPAALGNANLAAQDAGRQVRLDRHEDGPQVPGHDRDAARAAQMPTGQRRPRQGQQTTGRNVRWYPAPTTEARGPQRPQAGPGHRPPQGADPSAPKRDGASSADSRTRCKSTKSESSPISKSPDRRTSPSGQRSWPNGDARPSWSAPLPRRRSTTGGQPRQPRNSRWRAR